MKKYTHITSEERTLIGHYLEQEMTLSQIARLIRRPKSTISREIRRNRNKSGVYNPPTAFKRYRARRQRLSRLDTDLKLQQYVLNALQTNGWSPEMIAVRLKRYGHEEGLQPISHETIYAWIYRSEQKKRNMHKFLVRAHAKRGRRKRAHRGQIKERMSLAERPPEVVERSQAGHWEADLISFKRNTQHILVLHERKTRYTATVKLENKTAEHTLAQMLGFLKVLPEHLIKTVTFDNGMEFGQHWKLKEMLGIETYFCDVYASWQKAGIENMNGRLRRDLPRKTDLNLLSEADLEQIMISHNLMPRKVLEAKNPLEAFSSELGRDIFFLFNHGVALRP